MSPIDRDKAAEYSPGRGVLVTLTPRERALINEALAEYRSRYRFSPAEDEITDNLLRRIPAPNRKDLHDH